MKVEDLEETIIFICNLAAKENIDSVNIVLFPNISNRTSLSKDTIHDNDNFNEFINKCEGMIYSNVKVNVENVWNRFFRFRYEIEDVLLSCKRKCLWNANLFITADGDSVCCNDQNSSNKLGNISDLSIIELMTRKEKTCYSEVCYKCNQFFKSTFSVDDILLRAKLNL